jgi:hypothetical protein
MELRDHPDLDFDLLSEGGAGGLLIMRSKNKTNQQKVLQSQTGIVKCKGIVILIELELGIV